MLFRSGVAHRDEIARRLMAGGLAPGTPVAAVTWGTRPEQHTVRTTLGSLGAVEVNPPATIVVGAVAGLNLAWYTDRPLLGRRVVVTRARAQASELTGRLRRLGATVVELPTIATAEPADGGEALAAAALAVVAGSYAWVVFTSANAVTALLDLIPDARGWAGTRIAAVGSGTAASLAARGLPPDLVPVRAVAEGLVEEFASPAEAGSLVLWPRAAAGRNVLIEGLESRGWAVEAVEAYRTVAVAPEPALLEAAAGADAICFTSSSTVTNYLAAAGGPDRVPPVVASIGPVTSETAGAAGVGVTVEADPHTIPGLIDALVAALSGPPT